MIKSPVSRLAVDMERSGPMRMRLWQVQACVCERTAEEAKNLAEVRDALLTEYYDLTIKTLKRRLKLALPGTTIAS